MEEFQVNVGVADMTNKQTSLAFGADPEFDEMAEKTFPALMFMLGGCRDAQVSVDASVFSGSKRFGLSASAKQVSFDLSYLRNTHLTLPKNIDGRKGGVCTAALLGALTQAHQEGRIQSMSWISLLKHMRENMLKAGFDQIPQVSCTRMVDVHHPFKIVNDNEFSKNGTKRAVMIGINYVGQEEGELSGCHNDVRNMIAYLKTYHGFEDKNMEILMDDGQHTKPTYRNIMCAYRKIVKKSRAGDSVFLHYSGHGGRIKDKSGDEHDGYDETIVPCDYYRTGQIVDDELSNVLVKPMCKGVLVTSVMDACHSGTVLDLPYRYRGDGQGMGREKGYNFKEVKPSKGWCSRT